jgi:hypothetical protein
MLSLACNLAHIVSVACCIATHVLVRQKVRRRPAFASRLPNTLQENNLAVRGMTQDKK